MFSVAQSFQVYVVVFPLFFSSSRKHGQVLKGIHFKSYIKFSIYLQKF